MRHDVCGFDETIYTYNITDMLGPNSGMGIAGFVPWHRQPYAHGQGLRLRAPAAGEVHAAGYTEVVHVADGLHIVIADWPGHCSSQPGAVWAESCGEQYGWLYIGLEGDGSVEIPGFGRARRRGATCSLTVTPPNSTYLWRAGGSSTRRGISIAFHASYLRSNYAELSRTCRHSLGDWLSGREATPRDFDLPLLPVMRAATASLLDPASGGCLRHQFVSTTVQQLLCLSLAALAEKDADRCTVSRFSIRDRTLLRQVGHALEENLAESPDIGVLVKRFGINRNKLRFGFKEMYGMTISEYIHRARMHRAHALLREGRQTVTEIAAAVGYGHVSNFTTAFKRAFGETPSQIAGSGESCTPDSLVHP